MTKLAFENLIGQLFIIGFQGHKIEDDHRILEDISKSNLGGVILFDRHLATGADKNNIVDASHLGELTARLQTSAASPLFIGVDQEGGRVSRFKPEYGFEQTPAAESLGLSDSTEKTYQAASTVAQMLAGAGINMNFAPVVDLNINPQNPIIGNFQRSFAKDADRVTDHAKAWIKAHKREGVITCLKHFPGHGSSVADSHLGFVDISDTWKKDELKPYFELIGSGDAQTIMTGHLYNSQLDPKYPATLSQKTVDGVLRKDLSFTGVVISDDMQMKAITDRYGLEEACCMAIAAGIDLVIIGNNLSYDPEIFKKVHKAILAAVKEGRIRETRIVEAWERINALKTTLAH